MFNSILLFNELRLKIENDDNINCEIPECRFYLYFIFEKL